MKLTLLDFHITQTQLFFNFTSHVLKKKEKSLLCNTMPPKGIDYADLLTQFEILYKTLSSFEMRSAKWRFSERQIKKYFFLYLKIL